MKAHRILIVATLALALVLTWAAPAWAQEGGLRLGLSKVWGFSGGGRVQGRFNLSASGTGIISVTFLIDGTEMATVTQPPFQLQFDTGRYPLGVHTLTAAGRTAAGATVTSNAIRTEFVTAEAAFEGTQRIMIPLLAVVALAFVLATAGQYLVSGRGKRRPEPGAPRQYGLAGGAICSRCGRPFARHFMSPNLLLGKLERCPYCGHWGIVPAASRQALEAAEAAEREASQPAVPEVSAEEQLRRQIEESKYQ